jgi:hypothetical protein
MIHYSDVSMKLEGLGKGIIIMIEKKGKNY